MLHSINDISILLSLSKMTIYRKLKVKELKPYIVIKQGVQYLDDDGLTLLTEMLNNKCETVKDDVNVNVTNDSLNEETAIDIDDYITFLKSEIDFFKSEIQEKNSQIENLNNRLASEQELTKNRQVLELKQPKDIKALEQHFKDLDNSLIEIRERMEDRKNISSRKNIFQKIFKK